MLNKEKAAPPTRVGSTADRLKEKSYEHRMCRLECYPICLGPDAPLGCASVEEWVTFIEEVGVEVQVLNCEVDRGTPRFQSKLITPHPKSDGDRLARFLSMAHERSIIVLSYFSMNYNKPLRRMRPEWLMRFLDDGRPEPDNLGWFCFNSPYRDWLVEYLTEYLDHLDIDGFYFDDTNFGTHEERPWTPACRCAFCEALFRKETGLPIPHKVDFESMAFRHFVNWRYEKVVEFLQHVCHQIQKKHPDVILDINAYLRPQKNWSDGHPLRSFQLEKVGAHFFVVTSHSLREPGFVAKMLRSTGTPFAIFRNVTQTVKGFDCAPYPEVYPPAIAGLSAMINGGAPCGAPCGGPTNLQKDAMQKVFYLYKQRSQYVKGETLKFLALHYSQMNRDFRPSEMPKNTNQTYFYEIGQKDAYGAYEMLNRSHVPLDIVLDEHITTAKLSQYRVLFLSNSACLSDEQCDAIRYFVQQGGTLIATHQTSLLNEWGEERSKFALGDVLGVEYQGPGGQPEDHTIVYFCRDKDGFEQSRIVCFYSQESAVSVGACIHVLFSRSRIDAEVLRNFDPRVDFDSSEPAITSNRFGEGQAIYIAGDVGGAYMNSPYPCLRRLIKYLVMQTESPIEVEAPEVIEMTAAYRTPKELMIHFLNNPVPLMPWHVENDDECDDEQTMFHAPFEVNPICDIRITFNGIELKSVRLGIQNLKLAFFDEPPAVIIPRVDLHEVLLAEIFN